MEASQKEWIQENLYSLFTTTICSPEFLSVFERHGIFSSDETNAIMEQEPKDKSYQFYQRLMAKTSKRNPYTVLLYALKETKQMLPHKILDMSGSTFASPKESAPTDNYSKLRKTGTNFKSPPEAVVDFLKTSTSDVLIFKSQEPQLTLARMLDTLHAVFVDDPENAGESYEPGALVVHLFHDANQARAVKKSLKKGSRLVILYSPEQSKTMNVFKAQPIPIRIPADRQDSYFFMGWEDLLPSFQAELLEKLKKSCGFELSNITDVLHGTGLGRLIKGSEGRSLFGKICEDFLNAKQEKFDLYRNLLEDLGRIAVRELFPQWERIIFGQCSKYSEESTLARLVSCKLLKRTFKFHFEYTFTNPWMSHYIMGKFLTRSGTDIIGFQRIVLGLTQGTSDRNYEFENKMTAYFLDFHLDAKTQIDFANWGDVTNTVVACVNANLPRLLANVLPHLKAVDWPLLKQSVLKGSSAVVDLLLPRFDDLDDLRSYSNSNASETLLHGAINYGNLELSTKLLFDYNFGDDLNKPNMRNLIHCCVENTLNLGEAEVAERTEIVKLLVNLDSTLLKEKSGPKETPPLLCNKVHLNLIELMIQLGADASYANVKDYKRTLAFVIARGRTPEQYHEAISYFVSSGNQKLLKATDGFYWNPMQFAVCHTDLLEETIQLFVSNGVKLQGLDRFGENVIFQAIKFGRSSCFIHSLVSHGVNWRLTNRYGENVLFKAVREGKTDAIQYFTNLGLNVNGTESLGFTPLHIAFMHSPVIENQVEVVSTLLKLGAKVNKARLFPNRIRTPLWYALKGPSKDETSDDALLLMIQNGAHK